MNEKLISSKHTKLAKNHLSNVLYAGTAIIIIASVINHPNIFEIKYLIFVTSGFGIFLYIARAMQKYFLDPLADKVYDCGEYFKISHNNKNTNLPLSKIVNVGYGGQANKSYRVILSTSENIIIQTENKIHFWMDEKLMNSRKDKYIDDLIKRIDEARRNDS